VTVKVNKGDRARVILEGVVGDVYPGAFILGDDGSNHIVQNAKHVVRIEVLAKQFKVGDTVSGDDFAKLPVGTVVKHREHAHVRVKVAENNWIDPSEPALERPNHWLRKPRTIVHLP
jgi:hypothetical protein